MSNELQTNVLSQAMHAGDQTSIWNAEIYRLWYIESSINTLPIHLFKTLSYSVMRLSIKPWISRLCRCCDYNKWDFNCHNGPLEHQSITQKMLLEIFTRNQLLSSKLKKDLSWLSSTFFFTFNYWERKRETKLHFCSDRIRLANFHVVIQSQYYAMKSGLF